MKTLHCVMLVDDNQSTNHLNKLILKKQYPGLQVKIAKNGEEALAYLSDAGNDPNCPMPELILLDINMPRINGWEFLEAWRQQHSEDSGAVILLMLSTPLNEEGEQRALTYPGVAGFLEKPLSKERVIELVQTYFDGMVHEPGS